ncbi:MAG: hypothetical protein NC453_26185 [Muribaculum sp.]|nr:hypothetical protein [Muribaculum sp.]
MPSAALGASPALPQTALPGNESGRNTEWLIAGVGSAGNVALPTLAVSATPCSCHPLHLILSGRRDTLTLKYTTWGESHRFSASPQRRMCRSTFISPSLHYRSPTHTFAFPVVDSSIFQ